MPLGLDSVKLYMTLFFFFPPLILLSLSSCEAAPSWKVLPLLHKLQPERLRVEERGKKKREKNKRKVEEYCGKMIHKDKKDLEWVKAISSGGSETFSSSDPEEKRKNKRAGGNWKQSEGGLAARIQKAWKKGKKEKLKTRH